MEDIMKLMDWFVDSLSRFNCYKLQDRYRPFIHDLHRLLMKLDSNYFQNANPKLILELVEDKLCETFTKRPREGDAPAIEVRKSMDNIPQSHNILTRMAQQEGHKALGEAAVVKLFSHLQMAHDDLALVAGQIATLGEILEPEQFMFKMQRAVCPLVQLKIPGNLCSPTDVKVGKERLTAEETFEEECCNKIL